MLQPSLSDLLAYKNQNLLVYFCHHHPTVSETDAQRLFNDLLAWMWLNRYRQTQHQNTYLFGPLFILDELWHAFILHTQDYVAFCQHYFGDYFHHQIEPVGFEHALSADELSDFLNDCFEYLGQDWVMRYFGHLIEQ